MMENTFEDFKIGDIVKTNYVWQINKQNNSLGKKIGIIIGISSKKDLNYIIYRPAGYYERCFKVYYFQSKEVVHIYFKNLKKVY